MLISFCSWIKSYKITLVVSRVVYNCEMWQFAAGDVEDCNSSANKVLESMNDELG